MITRREVYAQAREMVRRGWSCQKHAPQFWAPFVAAFFVGVNVMETIQRIAADKWGAVISIVGIALFACLYWMWLDGALRMLMSKLQITISAAPQQSKEPPTYH